MSTLTIPAKTIVSCDGCQETLDRKANWRQEGRMRLQRHALDFSGAAVASADIGLDLCDTCLDKVVKAINQSLTEGKDG